MDFDPVLVDELQELSLERSVDTYKSPEEIERLTVDEHLSDIERAVYLLSSGQEVQRISVINNLPDLLRDHHEDCMRRVVPKVREVLHVAQTEMQLAACTAFLQILRSDLVPLGSYTQTFLQTILMAIDSRDPDVANAWLETLLDVIELLPKDVIKREILGIAVAKGQLSQSVQSRLACCNILGKIATKFEPFVIKKDILPVVQSLCQDVDYEVRGCMCRQLDPVARGLGLEATKSAILPELVELTNDEESFVRLAGLETVVNVLSLLDDDTCTETIIPLVCKFCQQAFTNEDSTLPAVARNFGKLCHGLSVNLDDDEKHWFVEFYRKLCRYGASKEKQQPQDTHDSTTRVPYSVFSTPDLLEEEDPGVECRRNAAYNLPAMVMFCGSRYFKGELSSSFTMLCKDCNHHVRKSVASGFHEVAKLMGQNVHHLLSDLIVLLRDDNLEVLKGLVPNLPIHLELMSKACGSLPAEPKDLSEILSAMIDCEAVISSSNNWRLQAELIEKFSCLPGLFPSDLLYHKIVPLMFKKLHYARALPVKHAASRTLLILLRCTKRFEQREDICDRLIYEFGQGTSFYQRTLFITICEQMREHFSRHYIKEHVFEAVIDLTSDAVPNIRLRVCPLLPKLKACVKLPGDRNLLQMLEQAVRKMLMSEKDIDVTNAMQKAVEELDITQVQMESLTKKAFLEEDLDDHRKEEEEMMMIEREEKEKREEDHHSKLPKGERRKDKDKKDRDGSSASLSKIPAPKKVTSKIPALSAGKDRSRTSASSSSSRSEKNGTTTKNSHVLSGSAGKGGKIKRETGQLNASSSKSRLSTTSVTSASRKGSASSVSSSSSSISSSSSSSIHIPRRSSLPSSSQPESIPKKQTSTPRTLRRISTGSMGTTGNSIPVRKKSVQRS